MAAAGPGQIVCKRIIRPRKGGSPRNTLGYAAQDNILLIGISDVPDAFADIPVTETVDQTVRNDAGIVDDKPFVEIDEAVLRRCVIKQAAAASNVEVGSLGIGLIAQRATPGNALLPTPRDVVAGRGDGTVRGVFCRWQERL